MDDRDRKELVRQAFLAQQQAYAPYSEFLVGAARSQKTVRSIKAATLRMRHIRRATVRSGQHFLRQCQKAGGILRR